MSHQFTIQFTEEHVKYACRKSFMRQVGIGFPFACLLIMAVAVQRMTSSKMDLISGILLAVVVLAVGILVSAYIHCRSYRLSQFRKTGNLVSYEFTEKYFKAKSEIGSSELKWEFFTGIWIFPKIWLLLIDKAGYVTLPVDQISDEIKDFLKHKIVSVGGVIK